jgi:hypothetical protein
VALRNADAPVGVVSLVASEVNAPPGNPEPASVSVPVKPPLLPAAVQEPQVPAAARAGPASTTAVAATQHRTAGSHPQRRQRAPAWAGRFPAVGGKPPFLALPGASDMAVSLSGQQKVTTFSGCTRTIGNDSLAGGDFGLPTG